MYKQPLLLLLRFSMFLAIIITGYTKNNIFLATCGGIFWGMAIHEIALKYGTLKKYNFYKRK